MKFSARTIQILRNFSTINPSIIFKEGDTVKTISQSKTVLASAKLNTPIEKQFAIYDLPQFLSAISLFEDPELIIGDSAMSIQSGNEKLKYTFSEPSLIISPPEKGVNVKSFEVEFELKNDVLVKLQKAIGIIGSPEIGVTGDGEKIYVESLNSKNSSDSNYRVEVGETDKTFRMIFLAENIKILPGDYTVKIAAKGISHFIGDDIEYFIAVESSSTYEG